MRYVGGNNDNVAIYALGSHWCGVWLWRKYIGWDQFVVDLWSSTMISICGRSLGWVHWILVWKLENVVFCTISRLKSKTFAHIDLENRRTNTGATNFHEPNFDESSSAITYWFLRKVSGQLIGQMYWLCTCKCSFLLCTNFASKILLDAIARTRVQAKSSHPESTTKSQRQIKTSDKGDGKGKQPAIVREVFFCPYACDAHPAPRNNHRMPTLVWCTAARNQSRL